MILLTLVILLLILGGIVFFITQPLLTNNDVSLEDSRIDFVAINAEYQVILNRIRELKQELQDGKISEEDYQERRSKLNLKAAEYLQLLQTQD